MTPSERTKTFNRTTKALNDIKANGGFIGKPPWGFQLVGPKYGRRIEPDPALRVFLRGMIDMALDDEPFTAIAAWLDAEGAPTATKAASWSPVSVRQILKNTCLKGLYVNGTYRLTFDSLLSAGEYNELQRHVERGPRGAASTEDVMIGPDTIACAHCGGKMNRVKSATTRKDGTQDVIPYYRCVRNGATGKPSTCANQVQAVLLEAYVTDVFVSRFGDLDVVEVNVVAGDGHADDIAAVEQELRHLDYDSPTWQDARRGWFSERARLQSLPKSDAVVTTVPTGKTVDQLWTSPGRCRTA